jgi:peptidoglycan-associated lipoprotein
MKKNTSIFLSLALLLALTSLVGCKSPGINPGGVYGSGVEGEYETFGAIPIAGRFVGGTEHVGMFEPVLFAYDSSQVAAGQRAKIEAVGQHLKQNPAHSVILEGHCDERGSREYNLALGERRALAVRTYLIGLGITSDRTQTKSYGEENPATPSHDESAWSQNRRGEFVLYY